MAALADKRFKLNNGAEIPALGLGMSYTPDLWLRTNPA
jgi:diketogulonate reductase-like aldo/keto reductase